MSAKTPPVQVANRGLSTKDRSVIPRPPLGQIAQPNAKIALKKAPLQRRHRRIDAWLWARLRAMPNESISFCSSFFVHLLLMLLLALLTRSLVAPPRHLVLLPFEGDSGESSFAIQEVSGDAMDGDEYPESPALSLDGSMPELHSQSEIATLRSLEADLASSQFVSVPEPSLVRTSNGNSSLFLDASMEGRDSNNRRRLALSNGGSVESEQAVDDALEWFARHQLSDGSWSTDLTSEPCKGRCEHGTIELGRPKKVAATGLALLCYLGAGHTHKKGQYKENVLGGLIFLTKCVKESNSGRMVEAGAAYEMYEHGIATLALCEAYQMTADSMLRGPLELSVEYIQRSQHQNGSWGYRPNDVGDLSIVGWQIMALKSATKIGLRVRPEVIRRADKFLDSQQSSNGAYYGYRGPEKEACTTAIGLLLRLYRGWPRTDPRMVLGAKYIEDLGPSLDGIYYNYYATQLLYHLKFDRWNEWNTLSRDYLVREQAKDGHEKGSWYFGRNMFNRVGGRLYNTAMATLTLEVYYRHLPIYTELTGDSFVL